MEQISPELLYSYLSELHSDAKCALNYKNDFELLVSIVLSAQTTDKAVNIVAASLFLKYPNIEAMKDADIEDIGSIIKPIGIYKNKAKNVIELSKKLYADGFSYIPNNFDYLISLPGVGRKTANVFLAEFYDADTLGVDTHILRISKRLNICSETDDAYDTEMKLKDFMKLDNFKKFHHMLLDFGRNECTAKNPKCEKCKISGFCLKTHC